MITRPLLRPPCLVRRLLQVKQAGGDVRVAELVDEAPVPQPQPEVRPGRQRRLGGLRPQQAAAHPARLVRCCRLTVVIIITALAGCRCGGGLAAGGVEGLVEVAAVAARLVGVVRQGGRPRVCRRRARGEDAGGGGGLGPLALLVARARRGGLRRPADLRHQLLQRETKKKKESPSKHGSDQLACNASKTARADS
eukprot:scaffold320012_cov40-Prasinocladus_malaysianus.AAC.2